MGVRARSMGISTVGCVAKRAEEWKKKRQRGTKRSEGIRAKKSTFSRSTLARFFDEQIVTEITKGRRKIVAVVSIPHGFAHLIWRASR
jgi:hypothetical protein